MENKTILITGGSGLIGTRLTELLLQKGFKVNWLSRKKGQKGDIKIYKWDYQQNTVEEEAIISADYIVHLAGASVAGKRWSVAYKKEILESRVKSTELLLQKVSELNPTLKAFISASAIGIYGSDRGPEILNEDSKKGTDFLAEVTKQWEAVAENFKKISVRTAIVRVGIVLAKNGGALKKMVQPIKLGVGSALGSGRQYVSWIHIDDMCKIFIKVIEDDTFSGAFNGVADNPVSNEYLTEAIANTLNKKILLPNAPAFALKLALGEMASSVLGSLRVSNEKIKRAGFQFEYKTVEQALINLLRR